nr:thioredoxin [uncultured Ruminococcus sp.]
MAVEHLNDSNFAEKTADGIALVDFFATWCGPCKMLGPVIEEIGAECDGSFSVYKVDIDECEDIAMDYGIMSVPTVAVLKNGVEVERMVGVQPKAVLLNAVANAKK